MKKILFFPFVVFAFIFGKFEWTAPPWLYSIYRFVQGNRKSAIVLLILACACYAAYLYYESLPKPVMLKAQFDEIQLTPNEADAKPSNLNLSFEYDFSKLHDDQARPSGTPSVARIDLVGKDISSGIKISPVKRGKWRWIDDQRMRFIPESDWPPGTQYTITFESEIFVEEAVLSEDTYTVTTPHLSADFSEAEFYQDPKDSSVRRVVATLKFSHPVDKETLEKKLRMGMPASGENALVQLEPYQFTISFDNQHREAYIQSEPVTLPEKSNYMTVTLAKGLRSILGGEGGADAVETKVFIPDVYSFLKAKSHAQIIRNEKNEPEQVVMLEFTDDIDEKVLVEKTKFYLLPRNGERNGKRYWKGPREVTQNVIRNSKSVDYELIPNERSHSKIYNFKLDIPENRYLYLKIEEGLSSVNKFVHSSFYDNVIRMPKYPKEVNIAGDGSVLSYSGNHELTVLTRGVSGLKYEVGRLLEGQLYHLISQTSGDIKNPDFNNWSFNEQNIADFETGVMLLAKAHPKQANYSSIDLTHYLPQEENRFGLFFVEVKGYDYQRKSEIYGANDKRLILVTDLGVIVKNNADHSHDLFVQSVTSGEPVANASVELLGKNGVPVFSGKTDYSGRASIPVTQNLSRENQPTVYVVKSGKDLSFLPFDRRSRQINLSKFDIGGVRASQYKNDALNAYLFSDRGIYRPGEAVNLGMIVKNFDLSNVENIPLELVIRGPRNKDIKVSKFKLPKMGFSDYQYATDLTSDTGNYRASLHLVRNKRYRGRELGSVGFKVEEFQPDTMKIESKLVDTVNKGWNVQEKIKAKVTLSNLFGTPAQDRKMTGRLVIQPHNFKFDAYEDYRFTDPFYNERNKPFSINTSLGDKRTNADGLVEFDLDLSKFRQGTYSLQFSAEGFDQAGGRSVVATNRTLISPLKTLIGYKANGKLDYINAKSERSIDFIGIDKKLQKTSIKNLKLILKEIQSVSTLVKQKNGTYKYQTITKEEELSSQALTISKKGYQYLIDTQTPGDFALEISDAENRRLSRVEFSVVGFANLAGKIDKNAELQVRLDQQDYKPGDVIEMSIKAPYRGAGLITIETDRVHTHRWFKTFEESSVQQITVPEGIEGTGYVNVAFLRDVSSKEIFTSPLSYAVEPFSIDKSKRRIGITLASEKIVRPGKPMDIGFSTSKPSKIVVFAVDEGILQVAKYSTPDPLSHFLKKRALDVETLQILDLILPDFNIVKELSASGGGSARSRALAKNLNPFARKTDKPAVFWSGIYDATDEVKNVQFDVPDTFSGELRVMAVAVSEEAVGASSTSSIVRGPFVLSPNVLTQAAPGDEFAVTLGVANIIDGSGKGAEVEVTVQPSEHVEIMGERKVNLIIDEGNEGRHTFQVKAKNKLGAAELSFTARYKKESSTRTASFSVRPASTYYSSFQAGYDKDGFAEITNLRKLYPDLAKQSVAASSSPLVVVDGLQRYLEAFPHGCTEQVVSKVFPLVGLMSHPAYAPHLDDIRKHFSHVIDKLRERQLADGGFAFWPGHSNSKAYPSIYAMHFLLEASEKGYPVPADMLERGKDYLKSFVVGREESLSSARNRANAIYLLTRMGEVTTNYIVDLEDSLNKIYEQAQWKADILSTYMASTYQLLQKDQEARRLLGGYKLNSSHADLNDFRSLLAVDAQYVYLLAKHFEMDAKTLDGEAILGLTDKIFKGQYNTISAAYSILALGAYSKIALGNDFNEKIIFNGTIENGEKNSLQSTFAPFPKANYGKNYQSIEVSGSEAIFYLNVQSGFNKALSDKTVREGIEIYRVFVDEQGNEVTTFEQGKELTVYLKVRALEGKTLSNIAIVDLLPGGFEVIRGSVSRTAYNWQADYIDVREDRVVFYGSFDSTVRELSYKVKLTSAGKFVIPHSYAESMYDRSIRAISEADEFSVIPSQ